MFDLDQSIAEWRQQLTAGGVKTSGVLDELESHLREDIDRQVRSGTEAPQAFDAAVRRMGQVRTLNTEFAKVSEVMSARQRTVNWVICAVAAILYGLVGVVFLFSSFGQEVAFRERILGAGACVAVAVIICSWKFSYRLLPVLPGKRMRLTLAFLSSILSGVCTVLLLQLIPASTSAPVPFVIAVLWAILPVAIAASIIFALEEAAYRKKCDA